MVLLKYSHAYDCVAPLTLPSLVLVVMWGGGAIYAVVLYTILHSHLWY